jgi:hypothetical protein
MQDDTQTLFYAGHMPHLPQPPGPTPGFVISAAAPLAHLNPPDQGFWREAVRSSMILARARRKTLKRVVEATGWMWMPRPDRPGKQFFARRLTLECGHVRVCTLKKPRVHCLECAGGTGP